MSNLMQSVLARWLLAILAFPIGGYVGHLVSQLITGIVVWRLLAARSTLAATAA